MVTAQGMCVDMSRKGSLRAGQTNSCLTSDRRSYGPDSADPLWTEDETAGGLSVQPPKLDFGEVEIGAGRWRSVTVTNQESQSIDISAIKFTGRGRSQFALPTRRDTCSSTVLAPQQSCSFRVRFEPTATGRQTAKVVITSNDPTGRRKRVKLRGIGVASSPDE